MTGGIVVLLTYTLLALAQPAATPPPELRLPERRSRKRCICSSPPFARARCGRRRRGQRLTMADQDLVSNELTA